MTSRTCPDCGTFRPEVALRADGRCIDRVQCRRLAERHGVPSFADSARQLGKSEAYITRNTVEEYL